MSGAPGQPLQEEERVQEAVLVLLLDLRTDAGGLQGHYGAMCH